MRNLIRVRLALWYTFVMALLLVVTGAGVYLLLARSLQLRAERHLQEDAAEFRALVAHEAEEEAEPARLAGGRLIGGGRHELRR